VCDSYDLYELICTTPAVTVPPSIRNYLESASSGMDNVSFARGRVVDNENNSMKIDVGIVFNDNPIIQYIYRDFSLQNESYKMVLTAGPTVVMWNNVYQHQRGIDSWKQIQVCRSISILFLNEYIILAKRFSRTY
jgi:hypothetical protein